MPYVSDTELLLEYDDEAWTRDDELAERGPRFLRSRPTGIRPPPISQARPVGGLTGGNVTTPGGGRAQVRFDKPLATKESVDELAKELKRDIAVQAEVVKKLDQTVEKNTAILDKKVESVEAALKRGLANAQQAGLLPMLLSKPPDFESVTWGPGAATTTFAPGGISPVQTAKPKKDDNLGLLLLMMMGGFGGSGSSGDSSNMLLMALALGGGFGR
jgi:hypothetical protein